MRKLFFELMQVSVGQLDCVSRFPEPDEWRKFHELAVNQAVVGVCHHGVTKLFEYGLVAPQELSLYLCFARVQGGRQHPKQPFRRS